MKGDDTKPTIWMPEVAIIVKGGCVQCVSTIRADLKYRIIDLDTEEYSDCWADRTNVDVQQITEETKCRKSLMGSR